MSPLPNSKAPTTPAQYSQGDLVAGKYLLERLIGEGGMGGVWLAHNMDLDASVAIKLLGGQGAPIEAAARLRREARAEARLEHRAIVRVFDCGETERGDPFIVMELLEGQSLADLLEEKRTISVLSVIQILLPIIDGLSVAHDEGIVHRDIKPENIFLARGTRCLQPKVVDFGIAKMDRWDPNPNITIQGTVIGSPSYMAPEQARGLNDVDHRADVWAVCAVLYEAVAGTAPFRGDTYNAILRSIIEDEITPLTNMGADEAALWTVLERGFAKDRSHRFQTMRELGTALAGVLVARGTTEDICGDSIASSWGVRAEPSDDASGQRSALSASSSGVSRRADLPTERPPAAAPASGSWQMAPTSTSGLVTPSGVVREPRRSFLFPALAAVALTGLAATGLARWSEIPSRSAPGSASIARAPGLSVPPRTEDAHVVAAAAASPSMNSTPSVTLAPVAKEPARQQPSRPKAGKTHHGWPQSSELERGRPALPSDAAPRTARADAATVNALGLKAAYR